MRKLKVVIAGSTGFLGRALTEKLAAYYDLTLLKRDPITGFGDLATGPLPDIPKADVLYHVAGVTIGRINPDEIAQSYSTNIQITLNLLSLCRKSEISKIIFASSYVYGHPKTIPINEDHPIEAISPYMHSKILCEDILKAYSHWADIDVISLRLFNVYGPNQRPGLLIPDIISQLDHTEITLGDSRPKRDFIYIDDVVDAFDRATQVELKGWNAMNIGSGESYSVAHIAQTILKKAKSDANLRFNRPSRPVEIDNVVADIRKAVQLLEWKPKVSLQDGIQRTVASARLPWKVEHVGF